MISLISISITWDTAIAIHVVLVIVLICVLSSLPKEKERGSKGRVIYRAVGGQVTYATLCGPAAYAPRHSIFTTSTYINSFFLKIYLN